MSQWAKRLVYFVACWQLGVGAASAAGDKVGTIAVSFVGGPGFVTTDALSDSYNLGTVWEARLAYCLSPHLSLVPLRGGLASFSVADDAEPGITSDLRVSSFVPAVLLALDNEMNVSPYFLVGAGIYRHRAESTKTDVGFDVGAGIELAVGSSAAINFEARLSSVRDADIEYAPFINFGFTYYFGAN